MLASFHCTITAYRLRHLALVPGEPYLISERFGQVSRMSMQAVAALE
jgi:hypothetical protein